MAKTTFSPNTIAKSQEVNDNFEGAYDGTLDYDNNRLELTRQHHHPNFVVSGLTIATSANLSSSILAGKAYISNATYRKYVEKTSNTAKTFTASKDIYVDEDSSGTFYYVEVANGATSGMTATANTVRIAKVVTSGSAITSVTQSGHDPLGNLIYPKGASSSALHTTPYKAFAYRNAGLTSPSASAFKINLDTEDYDSGANFDSTTNFRFTAPVDGFYQVSAQFTGNIASNTATSCFVYKNGSAYLENANGAGGIVMDVSPAVNALVYLVAGDYLELWGRVAASGYTISTVNRKCYLNVYLQSAS